MLSDAPRLVAPCGASGSTQGHCSCRQMPRDGELAVSGVMAGLLTSGDGQWPKSDDAGIERYRIIVLRWPSTAIAFAVNSEIELLQYY